MGARFTSTLESLTGPNGIVSIQHLSTTNKYQIKIQEIQFTKIEKYGLQDHKNTYLNFHLGITDRTVLLQCCTYYLQKIDFFTKSIKL